ncbi:Hypothetical predicted protein [Mytilus galloprovincialis]|uniref:Reverse transcriptase domain-containing protein n=1 Tax=Mytilus galloprovincialis TaxID=29158 RepID=A0A8B6EN90_MYTGA|nr:Hypothetical predicted protein [Mytilus galloprovincialis]
MSVFISSTLPHILNVLDHNKDFITINSKIRQCCTVYLNSNQASCTRTTDINTSIQQDQYQHSKQNSASASLKSLINASDQQQNDYCPTCENLCSSDDKAVECEICNKWLHYKCENLTVKEADEIENNLSLQYNCNSCKTLKSLQSDLLVSQLKHAPENTGIQPTTSIRSRSENSDTSTNLSHPTVLDSTPPRLNNCNVYPIPVTISATPATCNNTNILEEEIKNLKSQLGLKDKQLKTKESLICKQDSEIKLMKKELATNRALTIKLEQDKKDLEHSLLIQQQKPSNTAHEPSAFNREDNSRSYAMEQRVRSLEFELLKQDNKISNLADKFIDFKIDNGRKQPRTRKKKQKVINNQTADQFKYEKPSNDSCRNILFDSELEMRDDEAGDEQSPGHKTYVPPSSDKTSESCPSTKCPSTISSDPEISDPESTISPIESVKNLTTHLLNIFSFNFEGLTSNLVYLYKLIKRSDNILLQEHWLYSHEKDNLYTNFTDFNCHIKCFDDGIIDDVVDRKRGHAGVAICVNNKYSPYLEKLLDGSNRIAAIRLNFDVPLVIISVYLPSRSNNYSRDDYLSVLDELIEIVTKYRDSANILIGGDMNASIFRNHPRDNDFKNFLRNNNLRIPDNCVECSTFYHFKNRDESQIDYFIQNFDIINTYCTYSRESANTSTHDPIMVSVLIKTSDKPNAIPKSKHLQRINWNKIDKCEYQRLLELNLQSKITEIDNLSIENFDEFVISACEIITQTADSLQPPNSRKRGKNSRYWTPNMTDILNRSKYHYWMWKQEGTSDKLSIHYQQMRVFKKKLRSEQRKIESKKGKPKEDPGSYRKITITNPVGKLTEKLHLVRNKDNISNIQSPLQKGFTQGEIPLVAALILTELHTEAKENGNPLIIALTDAKSAFDVVWHDGLLREMNKAGLCGDNWLLFKDWYKGLNSNIKWQGQTSRTFLESQGVRQGGVWSPTAYKIFINSLLTTHETYRIGFSYWFNLCRSPDSRR